MPSSGLKGPYPLTKEEIDHVVTRISPGAYALGEVRNRIFYISYVGRSDDDINSRLKDWVGKKYKSFKFDYFSSPKAAFEKECKLWHDFGGPRGSLDNKKHPDRPERTNWKCPVCSIFD